MEDPHHSEHGNSNDDDDGVQHGVKDADSRETKRPKSAAESTRTNGINGGACKSREEQEPLDSGCSENKQNSKERQPRFAPPVAAATAAAALSTTSTMDGASVEALPQSFPSSLSTAEVTEAANSEFAHTRTIKVCGSKISR
jgi:hypothetical protein